MQEPTNLPNRKPTTGIVFTKAYATSDGNTFVTLAGAQKHALKELLFGPSDPVAESYSDAQMDDLLRTIVSKAAAVIDILSTTPTSRPRARKSHGGTRTRKPKTTTPAL